MTTTRPFSQTELFERPIKGVHAFSVIVGRFYEVVAAAVFRTEVLTTDSTVELCPDLIGRNGLTKVEVKAANTKRPFRLTLAQIENYRAAGGDTRYALIEYQQRQHGGFRSLETKTVQAVLAYLSQASTYMLVLDQPTIDLCIERLGTCASHESFTPEYLSLPHPLARRLVNEPLVVLAEWEQDPADWFSVQTWAAHIEVAGHPLVPFPVTLLQRKPRRSARVSAMVLADNLPGSDETPAPF